MQMFASDKTHYTQQSLDIPVFRHVRETKAGLTDRKTVVFLERRLARPAVSFVDVDDVK